MQATFIGGPLHAETLELQDDTKSFVTAVPEENGPGAPTVMYLKRTWFDPKVGDKTLMVLNGIADNEIDSLARPLMTK
jgi:hypothetical protein